MVHQNKAPTAYPAVGAFILVARSEDSNRATAPQCRNQQSSGLLVSPRESPRGMGKGAERAGGRDVAATQPYGKRKALFFIAIIQKVELVHHRGREQLRRRPPPAAETGSRSRGSGRRGQAPSQGAPADAGTATCRAPPPCVPAGKNGAVDHFRAQVPPQPDWPERGLYHPLRGGLMCRASACIRLAGIGR